MEVSLMSIVGRYKLLSHGTFDQFGVFNQTSDFLRGELIYSGEGYLSVLIFFNEDNDSNRKFLAYSGIYEIISTDEVIHKVNICSETKRNSSSENRDYKLIDNFLFLSCPLEDNKKFEAKWERIN
jgi:hypothetical protein